MRLPQSRAGKENRVFMAPQAPCVKNMAYLFHVPEQKKIDIIIDTDAKNEADDQFAITHALLSPKLCIKGIIASHFSHRRVQDSMEESYQECLRVSELLRYNRANVFRGNVDALTDRTEPETSEGVDFIIKAALESENMLYIAVMGPLTNIAAAVLKDERIAEKICVVYSGGRIRHEEGEVCMEANTRNDVEAFNVVMKKCPNLLMVPMDSYREMIVSLAELQLKVYGKNAIGKYLFEQLVEVNREGRSFCPGESWSLGDSPLIGILLNSNCYTEFETSRYVLSSDWKVHNLPEKVIYAINLNVRFIMEDFFAKLALYEQP